MKEDRIQINLRLSRELHEQIRAIADRHGLSRNTVLVHGAGLLVEMYKEGRIDYWQLTARAGS